MKEFILMSLLCIVLGISCAHTQQPSSQQQSSDITEQPSSQQQSSDMTEQPSSKRRSSDVREQQIVLEPSLFENRYTLWAVQGMGFPLAEHRYLLARDGEQEIKIRKAEDLAPLVKEITSAEQALEFVRFLTSTEIRPYLSDIYYSEVHEKVETSSEYAPVNRWFAIDAAQYAAWYIHEPYVKEVDGKYRIDRFVASYPRRENQNITPARLLRIWEWVDREGCYSMEIQTILAEGESIQKILLFQK